jgi:hypothetical protein
VVSVQGDAEVKKTNSSSWEPITQGMKLEKGDQISTGFQSSVQLAFDKNSVVTVKPLTQFTIREFSESQKDVTTDLDLKVGQVRAKVAKGPDFKSHFSVSTPTSVVSVRGTEKTVTESDMGTNVVTHEGHVGSANTQGEQSGVDQGQSSNTPGGKETPTEGIESSHDSSRTDTTTNTGLTDEEKDANEDYTDSITDPGTIEGAGTTDAFTEIFQEEGESSSY